MNIETGLTEMSNFHRSDRNLEEMSEHCPTVCQFWDHVGKFTARIDPKHLVSVDLATMCHPHVPDEMIGVSHTASRGKNVGVADGTG